MRVDTRAARAGHNGRGGQKLDDDECMRPNSSPHSLAPHTHTCVQVAKSVEGFSGREISKLMIALQSSAYGSENNELKPAMLLSVTKLKVAEHARKVDMVLGRHLSPRRRGKQSPF